MRSTKSFGSAPPPAEKIVRVRLLRALFVGGEAREAGSVASMALSDAQALRNSEPPKVEII